jgi:hypothetical protein
MSTWLRIWVVARRLPRWIEAELRLHLALVGDLVDERVAHVIGVPLHA